MSKEVKKRLKIALFDFFTPLSIVDFNYFLVLRLDSLTSRRRSSTGDTKLNGIAAWALTRSLLGGLSMSFNGQPGVALNLNIEHLNIDSLA